MRASRLVAIADLLQARGRLTAGQLAAALEVSPRTILRDLSELSSAGIPVFASRGSAGGFELISGYVAGATGPAARRSVGARSGGTPAGAAPAGGLLAVGPPSVGGRPADGGPGAAIRAHVLLSPRGRQLVALSGRSADFRARRSASPLPAPPGWIEGWLRTGPVEHAVLDVLGFGTEVEVISPPELRRAVQAHALRIAARHEDSRRPGR
jgi:predicted DNA-binding transcriptional regulator YafY